MTVTPFTLNVSQATLDDLQSRLARTRWPDEVEGAGWDYGANAGYMKELAAYWQNGYDWRAQEAALNGFAHFQTEIDGFNLHFIHERGKGPNPQPLLLLHGWPDSFYRFYKLIPMLTDPARFGGDPNLSFDVVVPSLPGFGFSDQPRQRGGADAAGLLGRLMTEVLGYERFGIHGGDTGSPVAQQIAISLPQAVTAVHLTDIGYDKPMMIDPTTVSEPEQAWLAATGAWYNEHGAYAMIQGTKPQTLAYGLNDSPAGLAGWIVQQFYTFSGNDGDIETRFTKDELLTNIMIYWVTQTINSSIRGYYEGFHADWGGSEGEGSDGGGESGEGGSEWDASNAGGSWEAGAGSGRVEQPVALALFPKDNPPPRAMAERFLNVQRWTAMPRGGHYGALEAPERLAEDMRAFFGAVR